MNRFFTYVDESLLEGDMYQKLMAIQDNYFRTQGNTEVVTQEELNENDAFLDAFLNTDVGRELFEFLDSKSENIVCLHMSLHTDTWYRARTLATGAVAHWIQFFRAI